MIPQGRSAALALSVSPEIEREDEVAARREESSKVGEVRLVRAKTMADNDAGGTRRGVRWFNEPAFEREPVLSNKRDTFVVGLVCRRRDIQRITRRMGIGVDQNKGKGYYEENKSDENIHGGFHELSGRGMFDPVMGIASRITTI